ncbi:mitogen-activated protein kinase 7-like [Patiria miniata]|uniref:Mitogen-activated protein kinase n=1 Tax=Patiria miniata TaxID=46514 RepID=A0A913ZX55_PATMI|nr:mitogen-activated protein kinase 7-like [Patiria miniata]
MQHAAARNLRAFKTKCLDVSFDLDNSEYRAIQNIGTGAYGVVCSATHKKTSEKVAIKKIPNAFEELTTAKRTYRELKIMRHFRHENVIGIREILMPKEPLNDFRDVYVVLDLMESDLHHIIHSQQSVSMEHIRYFLYQILRGLKYIHSANVVHRDLKPSNLLVNENCELKIGDFGMARGLSGNADSKRKMFMTVYVATRWYRAPELLFSNDDYSYAVDMWSVGCIFAEMLGRKQIFPGKNPMHQLTLIIEVLGMPPDSLLRSTNSDQIFNFFHRNFGGKQSTNLRDKYPNLDEDGKDLLSKMLVFNPSDRISVKDALSHPFLAKYHDPDDEPECFPTFDFSFEQDELTKQQIRQNVGKMILKYQRTKLFAGKKFPGSVSVVKPSTAATATSAAFQETKSAIMQLAAASVLPANTLPVANPPDTKQSSDVKCPPKEGIFKVPSIPAEEKKFLTPEAKPNKMVSEAEETLSVMAVSTLSVSNDVHMKSATRSAQNSAIGNTDGLVQGMSTLKTLTASSSNTISEDVEMKSAHGEQKEPLNGSSIGPSVSESQDVDMKSARRQGAETNSVTISSQVKDSLNSSKQPLPSVVVEGTGQKTISEDTKELIKAALRQSVLKNKMRKESEAEKGGGKIPVTAVARQREREQKRRQKLRRSIERQKKGKAKGKKNTKEVQEDDKHQMLTDEDRSMLERWNKMLKKKDQEEPSESDKAGDDSSALGSEHSKVIKEESLLFHKRVESDVGVSAAVAEPSQNTRGSSSRSSVTELGESVSSITNTAQGGQKVGEKIATSGVVETISVPTQQQISSLDSTASTNMFPFSVASKAQKNSYSSATKTSPSSLNNFGTNNAQLYFSQPSSQPMNTNPNHSFYAQSDQKSSSVITSRQTGDQQMSTATSSANQPPASTTDTATAQLLSRYPTATSLSVGFQPGKSDGSSGFQQYRSRHYSDRETPSPPHNIQQSPPAYEDSMKARFTPYTSPTGNPQSYPYKHSSQYLSLSKQSPVRQDGLPTHSRPSPTPPELAQVIRQLSKSAMEDSLPPILQVTPKGDGAGYGLSMDLEDWLEGSLGSPPAACKLDSGPLSASLLSDWLEVRDMNMDDMIAVQLELGLTSPFNLSDIPGLVESPKNKDRV